MRGTIIKVVVIAIHLLLFIGLYSLSGSEDNTTDNNTQATKTASSSDKTTTTPPPASSNDETEQPANTTRRPASNTATATQSQHTHHVVKSGDNLWVIAKKYNTTVANLKKWNSLNAKGDIHPGQKLVVAEN